MQSKKIVAPIIFILLVSNISLAIHISSLHNPLDGGWLEEIDGVKILHISGSHYDMGYQHGYLLKDEFRENLRAILNYSESKGFTFNRLLNIWNIMKNYVPQEYIEELQGLADGAGVSFNDVAALYIAYECNGLMECFGIVAWDNATRNGDLIHARSFDLPFSIKDPVTGKYVHENSVLIVRKPDDGYASISPSVVTRLNGGGGVNELGIAYGNLISWSRDQSFNGPPFIIRAEMVLDHTSTIEDAIKMVTQNRTLGWNYIISDKSIGYAIETNSNIFYMGSWDNPVESLGPFWSIDHVVRRTNFFIDPALASSQRDRYNPGGLMGLIKLLVASMDMFLPNMKKHVNFDPDLIYPMWRLYKTMSREIEREHGNLNLSNTISMMRKVYSGRTDLLLKIMERVGKGRGFAESWNQWVYNPETGDMYVSFATSDRYAYENPLHCFNIFDLLNAQPP